MAIIYGGIEKPALTPTTILEWECIHVSTGRPVVRYCGDWEIKLE